MKFKRDLTATGPDEGGERGYGLLTMKHDHNSHQGNENAPAAVVEVDIKNAYGGSDYAGLEACFCDLRGVTGAHLDRTRGVAHLGYDTAATTPEKLEEELRRRGYTCDCKERAGSKTHAGHPRVGGQKRAAVAHGATRAKGAATADSHAEHDPRAAAATEHYNLIAIPIAAGALYPSYGVLLRPEWAALAMSASTVTVTLNALMLNRVRLTDETKMTARA